MIFGISSLEHFLTQFITTFRRFPLAVISSLVMTFILVYLANYDGDTYEHFDTLMKIAFVASLGITMFAALRLMGDKNPLCLLGIGALVIYYFSLSDMKHHIGMVSMRHFFLILAFFIMILWAPFWKNSPSNEEYWEWVQRVVFALITAIIFSLILFAGLSLALGAIDKLFSLDISGKRYGQLFILVMGIFAVSYFLSQIPKESRGLKIHNYTMVESIFTKYILTPMAIVYFLILYTYTLKILFISEWPKGILAWVIVAFSVVALITYLFWTPLWNERAKRYRHLLFVVLLLQTIMLGLAIGMRISAYGWTQNRYMVAVLGLWLFGVSLYFLFVKNAKYKWIFVALSLIIIVSQVGPLSAYAVSKASQQERLRTYLETSGELSEKSDRDTRVAISTTINYLARNYGIESLKPIIPKIVAKYKEKNKSENSYTFAYFATKEIGFRFVSQRGIQVKKRSKYVSIYRPNFAPLDVSIYDWIVDVRFTRAFAKGVVQPAHSRIESKISKLDTVFRLDDNSLKIIESNSTIAQIPLTNFYAKILADDALRSLHNMKSEDFYKDKLDTNYVDQNVRVKIQILGIFTDINGTLSNVSARVLYKRF